MSRKFFIEIKDEKDEFIAYPLKKWINNNHPKITGYVFDENDITHRIESKLIKLGYNTYFDEVNNYQILTQSDNLHVKSNEFIFSEKIKDKEINKIDSNDNEFKLIKKLKSDFNRRSKNNVNEFENFDEFKNWYLTQEKKCEYCDIKEEDVRYIVLNGLLKSKRFPFNGEVKRGRARGIYLEVDRKDSSLNYSLKNCELACYFCNNDKSDVFGFDEYKLFFENRKNYLESLINKSKKH
jgi:hypothetical protein